MSEPEERTGKEIGHGGEAGRGEEAGLGGEAGLGEEVVGLAEPSQRLVARLVDTLIVGVPVATAATEIFPRETAQTVVAPVAIAGALLVYDVVQLVLWGRTLGKRLTGVRVVSADGHRLRSSQALVRSVIYALPPAARPVPILNVLAGVFWLAEVGLLFEGVHRQALHDRAAGTLVIDTRPRPVLDEEPPAQADAEEPPPEPVGDAGP